MALSKEAPGFDIDDEVLLMDSDIVMDMMPEDDGSTPPQFVPRPKMLRHSSSTNTLITPGLWMRPSCISMKSVFPLCCPRKKKSILRVCRKAAIRRAVNA